MATILSLPSATSSVSIAVTSWWLKDPLDPTANIQVYVVDPPKHTKTEQMGVHYPLGRTRPIFTSDVVTGHDGTLRVLTIGNAAWTALQTIKLRQTPLLLQSPYGEQWYVRLYDGRATTLEISPIANGYRETDVQYAEVDPP